MVDRADLCPTSGVKGLLLEVRVEAIHLVPRYAAGALGITILLQQLVAADLTEHMISETDERASRRAQQVYTRLILRSLALAR